MLIRFLNAVAATALGFASVVAMLLVFRVTGVEATTPILLALAALFIGVGAFAGQTADALEARHHRKERS